VKKSLIDYTNLINSAMYARVGAVTKVGSFLVTSGTATIFTIPDEEYNPLYDYLEVIYNGVTLNYRDNYNLNGRTITLTFGLQAGETLYYRATKNKIVDNSLTDGAFLKDKSVIKSKLDQSVIDTLDASSRIAELDTPSTIGGFIKKLVNRFGDLVLPFTSTKSVYDDTGKSVDTLFNNINTQLAGIVSAQSKALFKNLYSAWSASPASIATSTFTIDELVAVFGNIFNGSEYFKSPALQITVYTADQSIIRYGFTLPQYNGNTDGTITTWQIDRKAIAGTPAERTISSITLDRATNTFTITWGGTLTALSNFSIQML
jgi:hypothetical protein